MIKDMNAEEAIKYMYNLEKEKLLPFIDFGDDLFIKTQYAKAFTLTCNVMADLAVKLCFKDKGTYHRWYDGFSNLIDMCILADVEPMYKFTENYEGNTFVKYAVLEDSLYVIHHMEQFINVQTIRLEPLLWIELGNKVGITDIKL